MGIQGIHALYHIEDEVHRMSDDTQDHYDDEDVPAALQRETSDGSGFESEDELPESDFVAFAQDEVELTEEDPK